MAHLFQTSHRNSKQLNSLCFSNVERFDDYPEKSRIRETARKLFIHSVSGNINTKKFRNTGICICLLFFASCQLLEVD